MEGLSGNTGAEARRGSGSDSNNSVSQKNKQGQIQEIDPSFKDMATQSASNEGTVTGDSSTQELESSHQLLETLISLAELPEEGMADTVRSELQPFLKEAGGSLEGQTLQQLRETLALYLESLHSELSAEE